jgi:acetylornithine/succinyldiaminopimelate/putrescine aminotransferase
LTALASAISPITAAILLEPIQGEGGVYSATPEFLQGIVALAKKHDLLVLFDEVQAGFGRCGDSMAWRTICPEIEPDGISWAKGMGGGFPIGSFWVNDRLIDDTTPLSSLMNPGSHGSTYGGNPLACAASLAVLEVIETEKLSQHAQEMEALIRKEFATWDHSIFDDLRGAGLLLGFGIKANSIPAVEGKTPAQVIVGEFIKHGLLTVPAGPNTVRILPPLTVTAAEIHEALTIIRTTLDTLTHA